MKKYLFNNLTAIFLLLDDNTLNSFMACNSGPEVEESENGKVKKVNQK